MAPEDEAARGVAVEPMREGGPARQAEAQRVEIVLEARAALGAGMNGDAGRLVENEHHPVSVDEPRSCFFRGHGKAWYASIGRARIGRAVKEVLWRWTETKRNPASCAAGSEAKQWPRRRTPRRRPRTLSIPRPAPRPPRAPPGRPGAEAKLAS